MIISSRSRGERAPNYSKSLPLFEVSSAPAREPCGRWPAPLAPPSTLSHTPLPPVSGVVGGRLIKLHVLLFGGCAHIAERRTHGGRRSILGGTLGEKPKQSPSRMGRTKTCAPVSQPFSARPSCLRPQPLPSIPASSPRRPSERLALLPRSRASCPEKQAGKGRHAGHRVTHSLSSVHAARYQYLYVVGTRAYTTYCCECSVWSRDYLRPPLSYPLASAYIKRPKLIVGPFGLFLPPALLFFCFSASLSVGFAFVQLHRHIALNLRTCVFSSMGRTCRVRAVIIEKPRKINRCRGGNGDER